MGQVPILPQTQRIAKQGAIPGGTKANFSWLQDHLQLTSDIHPIEQMILCDAMTSGGLLLSMSENQVVSYCK